MTPQSCESALTMRMNKSITPLPAPVPLTGSAGLRVTGRHCREALLHRQGLIDELLAVWHLLAEFFVRTGLRHLDPGVVLFRRHRGDFDVVLLECSDHVIVELFGSAVEELFGLLAGFDESILLLLIEPVEA